MSAAIEVKLSKLQVAQAIEDYISARRLIPERATIPKKLDAHYQFHADYSLTATFTEHTEKT
jgi:hypothetical protein